MTDESKTLRPTTVEELCDVVRAAAENDRRLITGRRMTSTDQEQFVSLENMSGVIDYPARDMTITVQAGMPVSELRKVLETEKQQLPIDAFDPTMSVGALVAADVAGPRQYGYGTLRDYVIGIEAVDGQGRVFHAGGRVVKNVAGYDLCRLMTGSRSAFGILTQVTFKLKPLPEQTLLSVWRFAGASEFGQALERLNTSAARPVLIDFTCALTNSGDGASGQDKCDQSEAPYSLSIGVEGTDEVCRRQAERLRVDCAGAEEISYDGRPGFSVEQYCRSFGAAWAEGCIRVRTLPSQLAAAAQKLADAGFGSQGHAGSGILFVGDERGNGKARRICDEIAAGGTVAVSEWDADHPARTTDPLTVRLKEMFDPCSVFAL